MVKEKWTPGLSGTSIGRFGGMRDDMIPYDSGYRPEADGFGARERGQR